jgi:hypothetical protein
MQWPGPLGHVPQSAAFHRAAEHAAMWPRVKAKLAGDPHGRALPDAMDDEHQLLGPLQVMIDDAFTMDAGPGRLRQLPARLRTRLASHLAHKEADALPFISQFLSPGELGEIAAAIRGGYSTRIGAKVLLLRAGRLFRGVIRKRHREVMGGFRPAGRDDAAGRCCARPGHVPA